MLNILNNYVFLLFLTTLALSDNLVLFFISWVGLNISLYGILLKSFNSYNIEITLKYFISGSIITIFLLFSMLLFFIDYFSFNLNNTCYLYFNSENLQNIVMNLFISKFQKLYYMILIFSLLFKLGSFPFHFYISEIYESLDIKKIMFLYTVVLKIAIFITLLRFLNNFWFLNNIASDLLFCSGIGSVFIGSFSIIKQFKIKKFFSFSYLNSIGYIILSLASGISSDFGELSFYTAKVYFFTYILTWLGFFDILFSVRFNNRLKLTEIFYMSDLTFIKNNYHNQPIFNLKISILILTLSLMGLPPTFGFFSKTIFFLELVSNYSSIPIFIFILFLTPIVSFGYLRLLVYLLFPLKKNYFIDNFTSIEIVGNYSKIKESIFIKDRFTNLFDFKKITQFIIILPILCYIYEKNQIFSFYLL